MVELEQVRLIPGLQFGPAAGKTADQVPMGQAVQQGAVAVQISGLEIVQHQHRVQITALVGLAPAVTALQADAHGPAAECSLYSPGKKFHPSLCVDHKIPPVSDFHTTERFQPQARPRASTAGAMSPSARPA